MIILGHGFSQSKDQHVNQGRHLATRGFIVLIPNSNAASDHSRFADDLRKCIDWIEARDTDTNSLDSGTNRLTVTAHTMEFSRAGAGLETITVRDNTPLNAASQRFLRLKVTEP